jgi:hypothetical protein
MRRMPGQPTPLSRRSLLKAAGIGVGLLTGGAIHPALAQDGAADEVPPQDEQLANPGGRVRVAYDELLSFNEKYDNPPLLGRAETWRLRVVEDPALYDTSVVRYVNYSEVMPLYGAIRSDALRWSYRHNDLWFDVGDGYIHSAWIVPVREVYNEPQAVVGRGFWGEITVPTSWQHWEPKLRSRRYYDMAYGALFRVIDRADEPNGRAWYRLYDDVTPSQQWWVQANHVRRLRPAEFAPISPDVPPEDKRIEIDLDAQLVTCYEGDTVVLTTRCASGAVFRDSLGRQHAFHTPRGEHFVRFKRPSRRMTGGEDINDEYDLPGVPWCTFFTWDGVAIHGTYWHNDYGQPRSHGCVNVTIDAARWIYRWVNPYTGYSVSEHVTTDAEREAATRVIVF